MFLIDLATELFALATISSWIWGRLESANDLEENNAHRQSLRDVAVVVVVVVVVVFVVAVVNIVVVLLLLLLLLRC